ncbi:hypothetical protein ABZZ17_19395 [Streptomyces sp. NPDC006512]|uniref:hypothetical protein n=1 Tax=Streptomyces sp. NPDC006512 TaxID=3154307 RepID=UPI0033BD8C35
MSPHVGDGCFPDSSEYGVPGPAQLMVAPSPIVQQTVLTVAVAVTVTNPARNTALVELASELPAVVVSRLLGIHQNTADTWERIAGRANSYTAEVANRR